MKLAMGKFPSRNIKQIPSALVIVPAFGGGGGGGYFSWPPGKGRELCAISLRQGVALLKETNMEPEVSPWCGVALEQE